MVCSISGTTNYGQVKWQVSSIQQGKVKAHFAPLYMDKTWEESSSTNLTGQLIHLNNLHNIKKVFESWAILAQLSHIFWQDNLAITITKFCHFQKWAYHMHHDHIWIACTSPLITVKNMNEINYNSHHIVLPIDVWKSVNFAICSMLRYLYSTSHAITTDLLSHMGLGWSLLQQNPIRLITTSRHALHLHDCCSSSFKRLC